VAGARAGERGAWARGPRRPDGRVALGPGRRRQAFEKLLKTHDRVMPATPCHQFYMAKLRNQARAPRAPDPSPARLACGHQLPGQEGWSAPPSLSRRPCPIVSRPRPPAPPPAPAHRSPARPPPNPHALADPSRLRPPPSPLPLPPSLSPRSGSGPTSPTSSSVSPTSTPSCARQREGGRGGWRERGGWGRAAGFP
jgi:hypothetical protein